LFVNFLVAFAMIIVAGFTLTVLVVLPHKLSVHHMVPFLRSKSRQYRRFLGQTTFNLAENESALEALSALRCDMLYGKTTIFGLCHHLQTCWQAVRIQPESCGITNLSVAHA
jgi:hypothetical protein